MLLSLLLLLPPVSAFAGLFNGRATLPHCRFLDIEVPEACREQLPPDALSAILPVADRLVKDEQVRRIKDYNRSRMTKELDTAIEARKALLSCLDKPAENRCEERIRHLRGALEQNLRLLRFALALAQRNGDPADRSVSPHVTLPASLGDKPLAPLGPDELSDALRFQKAALFTMDRLGNARLRQQAGIRLSESALAEKCRSLDPDYAQTCEALRLQRQENLEQFRKSLLKIADSLVSQLPMTIAFRSAPITDDDLRRELAASLPVLTKWREDSSQTKGSAEDERLADAEGFTDEYVAAHPEACQAAEENIRQVGYARLGKTVLKTGGTILGMSTFCAIASPAVCFAVGTGLGAHGVGDSYVSWRRARDRLKSSDRETPDANLRAVHDKYRDFVVSAALSTIFTTRGAFDLSLPQSAAEAVKMLEIDAPAFFGDAGAAFDKVSSNVFDSLKGTAISQATQASAEELVTKDQTTRYRDWIRSDAFTARIFVSFLGHLAPPPP